MTTSYGTYCTAEHQDSWARMIEEFRERMVVTPDLADPENHPLWSVTDSDENCVLIDLWAGSLEFRAIEARFRETMPNVTLKKAFRVQVPPLFVCPVPVRVPCACVCVCARACMCVCCVCVFGAPLPP